MIMIITITSPVNSLLEFAMNGAIHVCVARLHDMHQCHSQSLYAQRVTVVGNVDQPVDPGQAGIV